MPVVIVVKWYVQYGKDILLQIIELGYKSIAISVGQLHFSLDDIFELFKHELAARITDISFVWHKSVQASVPAVYIIPGRSFDKHQHLQSNFEQKQKCFDSFRCMQVHGLNTIRSLCPAVDCCLMILTNYNLLFFSVEDTIAMHSLQSDIY
jgi:hypothetical protein